MTVLRVRYISERKGILCGNQLEVISLKIWKTMYRLFPADAEEQFFGVVSNNFRSFKTQECLTRDLLCKPNSVKPKQGTIHLNRRLNRLSSMKNQKKLIEKPTTMLKNKHLKTRGIFYLV